MSDLLKIVGYELPDAEMVNALASRGSRVCKPVKEAADRGAIDGYIKNNLPAWVHLFWQIGVSTGYRTSDICRMRYSDINFETGVVTICEAKQTKAAQTRAMTKAIEAHRKLSLSVAESRDEMLRLMAASPSEYLESLNASEKALLTARMIEARDEAVKKKAKITSRLLPAALIAEIKERMESLNTCDDFIFSRSHLRSNRVQNQDGCVSRQTVWSYFKAVGEWFNDHKEAAVKFSAYSLRKIFAWVCQSSKTGVTERGLAIASKALGHSNVNVTKTYVDAVEINTPDDYFDCLGFKIGGGTHGNYA
ncbi:tyrosine-type recombinase/integrase [Escherichia coli]|uniref:tyrosine-type recombinase/integrase n=1 Tax=Escherichia coli TaxID=562 RepID=UPI001EECFFE4|nr:tyrosine-type recombinase/integrase [Escherichia coli]MCF6560951.1 tyrosine-type recombinase/integrase [Escherichia coli]